ncbi:hypothetical protein MY3296_007109 [Beauveria thailandica]
MPTLNEKQHAADAIVGLRGADGSVSPDVVDGCWSTPTSSQYITASILECGDDGAPSRPGPAAARAARRIDQRKIAHRPKHRIEYHLRQIADASFDMTVHNPTTHQDVEALDETKLFQHLKAQSKFTPAEQSWYQQTTFSHLV